MARPGPHRHPARKGGGRRHDGPLLRSGGGEDIHRGGRRKGGEEKGERVMRGPIGGGFEVESSGSTNGRRQDDQCARA